MAGEKYDVGIIGVAVGANYGSVLTYFSLYKTIESFGKKVLMVSKIGASADDPEIKDNHAMRFAQEHYNLSEVYSIASVGRLNDIVDTFVIGSDQVWNFGVSRNFGKAFYLDFADDSKRKISYAASFGHAKDFSPEDEVPKISALMKRFNAISVRETSGVAIARSVYGVSAKQVADPIFLTTVNDYNNLAQKSDRDVSGPYLLAYILDPTPEKKAAIEHIARKRGLGVRIMLDGFPHLFQENKEKMNFDEAIEDGIDAYGFLKLFSNCSYVITDSFHGTAFAVKFGKDFAAIGNKRRGMTRFDSLLKLIDSRDRFTLDANDIVSNDARFLAPVDYSRINATLDEHVRESKLWLKNALEAPVKATVGSMGMAGSPSIRGNAAFNAHRIANFVRKLARRAKRKLEARTFSLDQPKFSANNAVWRTEVLSDATGVRVSSPERPSRGNFVWCDLPAKINGGAAYEMKLDWRLNTSSRTVNIHIRNSESGQYRVVGTILVGKQTGIPRTDTISFVVPSGNYDQIMFGSVHFTGPSAGADVLKISMRSILPNEVVPNAPSLPSGSGNKAPAEVVKEFSGHDSDRFINHYAQRRVAKSIGNSRALLMFYSHGLEKGLSRNSGFRPGFGEAAITPLSAEMNKWLSKGRDKGDYFFQIAVSVMRVYFDRHRALGADVSRFWKLFDPQAQEEINRAGDQLGGAWVANAERELVPTGLADRSFLNVVFSRRSIREFTPEAVVDSDIQLAVRIAMQAPSVCNRQSARVHQFDDPDMMQAALDLQGGFRGYKMPPKLLLVTSDLSAFVGAVERNQPFIDGGLFMMTLLLGLQQAGLGTCCLNTAMSTERENTLRKMLDIPDSEVFISFIAVGHFDPAILTPQSKRIPVDKVLVRHGVGAA